MEKQQGDNMNICTVDIETELIPEMGIYDISKIYCIGVKVNDQPTKMFTYLYHPTSAGNLRAAIDLINTCDYIVGHNLAGFDLPILESIAPITAKPIDTLIAAKMMFTQSDLYSIDLGITTMPKDLYASYSLKAFGYRIGDNKIEYEDFSKFNSDMLTYCAQDVELTYKLYKFLASREDYPAYHLMELECNVAKIISIQEYVGFYVDHAKARELATSLRFKAMNLKHQLLRVFKPRFLPDGQPVVPAKPRRQKLYIPDPDYQFKSRVPFRHIRQLDRTKNGKWKLPAKTKYKYFATPHKLYYSYYTGEYQKIKLTKFDPGSRDKIKKWLEADYGYQFPYYTPKGNAKVDADSLANLEIPEGQLLKEYLKTTKDLSQLDTGAGSILNNIRSNSTVTSRIDTNGTVTGRFTSSSINLNQIPAQPEFRELFSAPEGWTFLGADFDGQENLNMAELLYPYDGGKLYDIITNGKKEDGTDLHSLNAKALGVSRDDGKGIWFGFTYGSSEILTGYTVLGNGDFDEFTAKEHAEAMDKLAKRKIVINNVELYPIKKDLYVPFNDRLGVYMLYGRRLQQRLIRNTEGLDELIRDLTAKVNTYGYATTLLGRRIPAESSHVALNYHCQGMGAEAMKVFLHLLHQKLSHLNPFTDYRHQATIYDEIDMIVRNEYVEEVADIVKNNFPAVSKYLNMKCTYTGGVMIGPDWSKCH